MQKILYIFLLIFSLLGCQNKTAKIIHNKDIRVALVLGGGGSRTIAQIGVIETLEKNNIPIDLMVGTSGGSVVGAIYADNPDSERLKEIGLNFKKNNIATLSLDDAMEGTKSLRGGLDGKIGEEFIEQNLKAKNFKELKLPFIAVATDIITGETIAIKKGKISKAVRASCAIPGLFSPVEIDGRTLVDGGVTAPLGIDIAREYNPKIIIAVDVSLPIENEKVRNMIELVHRSANLSYTTLNDIMAGEADILIKPKLSGIGIFDDNKNEELYEAGKKAACEMIPKIKKLLYSEFS